ncbi:hypothetical protein D3C75_1041370 [compost metagenome]
MDEEGSDYAVHETEFHLILCNANRGRKGRLDLLEHFQCLGFVSILIHFEIPDHILQSRIASSQRSTAIFRSASTFEEVLLRQQAESDNGDVIAPTEGEADYLFVIRDSTEVQSVLQEIMNIAQSL